jgi:hypothetical protein
MNKILTNAEIEFKVSQITGSLALSGIFVTDEMKNLARKILTEDISVDTAKDTIKIKYTAKLINFK